MVQADKNDGTARHDLGMSLGRLGMIDPALDGTAESLAALQESRSLIEPILAANPKSSESADQITLILEYEGHRLKALGRNTEAIASYRRSMALLQPFLTRPNGPDRAQYISDEQSLALLYASIDDHSAASELADSALAAVQKYNAVSPPSEYRVAALAGAWATVAITRSKGGAAIQAQEAANEAMKLWNSVRTPSLLTVWRQQIADTQTLIGAQHLP
jgi:tetratricopeptide (TPR) repeat protein